MQIARPFSTRDALLQGDASVAAFSPHLLCVGASRGYAVLAAAWQAANSQMEPVSVLEPQSIDWPLDDAATHQLVEHGHAICTKVSSREGQPRWHELHVHRLIAPEDSPGAGYWAHAIDVTERVVHERMLESAWDRLERFSQAASEGIAFYADGVLADCNQALANMLGRTREHLIGQPVISLFVQTQQKLANRHIDLGRDAPYAAQLKRADGSTLDVEISGRVVNWRHAALQVACVRDVSQIKHVSESLLRSQARYRALVENAGEAIVFSQNQVVIYANPAAAALFGIGLHDLIGLHVVQLAHPDDRQAVLQGSSFREPHTPALELRATCPPVAMGHVGALPDHVRVKHVRASGAVVEWEGAPASMIFMTDITVQRESLDALTQALAQERQLGALKTRFVSMASHEFRTPLATVQSATDLLQHYAHRLDENARQDALDDIRQAVGRMEGMMENFLTLGRMQADAMACSPMPVGLHDLLKEITTECAVADKHQHLVMLDIAPYIRSDSHLMLDALLMRLILGNLVGNACKYSGAGQHVWVRVACHQTELPWLRIEVVDQGIGIPDEDKPRLFDAFHRASNTGDVRGTGVGLAIVARAVQAHAGHIDVDSTLGQGSRFSVSLPWVACNDVQSMTEPTQGLFDVH